MKLRLWPIWSLIALFSLSPVIIFADNSYSADFELSETDNLTTTDDWGIGSGAGVVSLWFKLETAAVTQYLWDFEDQATGVRWYLYSANSEMGYSRAKQGSGACNVAYAGYSADTDWHHVAIRHDGSYAYMYLDGALVAGPTLCTGTGGGGYTDGVYVGSNSTPANYIDSLVDEIIVYNEDLATTTVTALESDPCNPQAGYDRYYKLENDSTDETATANLTNNGVTFSATVPFSGCGGGDPPAATSTATTSAATTDDVVFGISILIFLQAMVLLGLIFKVGTDD